MAKKVSKAQFKHAMSKRMVDIGQTSWKEKSAGPKGQAGRLRGPGGKLYTGAVDLGGGKTATYEKGKRLKVDVSKKGFGTRKPPSPPTGGLKPPKPKTSYGSGVSTSSIRGIEKASGRKFRPTAGGLPGSGRDNVNAATSAGSARVSMARDSFIPEPGVRSRSPLGRGRPQQATQNRPIRGERSRLQRDKSGQLRWVKASK